MNQVSTFILRGALVSLALSALAFCIFVLPEGMRTDNVGGYKYILGGLYVPAIPFFIALYQAMNLLTYIDKNKAFSDVSVKALRNIHYCALIITALFAAGMPYIYIVAERDDAPGVILIGLVLIGASFTVATFSAVLQKLLQTAMDIKSENDLTV